jgi:hypothetical protein
MWDAHGYRFTCARGQVRTTRPLFDRISEKIRIEDNGCWSWTGFKDRLGYGRVAWSAFQVGAHRAAWSVFNRKDVPDGLDVLHTCDNRGCVNPAHLYVGTAADNARDMVVRGRSGSAKLTFSIVVEIRSLLKLRVPHRELARRFGVRREAISEIARGISWRHVP